MLIYSFEKFMDKIYNCTLDIFIEKRIKKAYLCLQEVAKTRNSFL